MVATAGTLTTINIPLGNPGSEVNISAGPNQKTLTYTGGLASDSFAVAYSYDGTNYLRVPNCASQGAAFTCQLVGPAQYLATLGAAGLTGSLNVSWVFANSVSSVVSTNQALNLAASGGAGTGFDTTSLPGLTPILTIVYANGNPGQIAQGDTIPGTSSTASPADQLVIEGSPDNTHWTSLSGVTSPCSVLGSNGILQCYAGPRYLRARYVTGQGTWPAGCGDFCNQATLTLQMGDAQISGGGGGDAGPICSLTGDAGQVNVCGNEGAAIVFANTGYPAVMIGQNVLNIANADGGTVGNFLTGNASSNFLVCGWDGGGSGGPQCTVPIMNANIGQLTLTNGPFQSSFASTLGIVETASDGGNTGSVVLTEDGVVTLTSTTTNSDTVTVQVGSDGGPGGANRNGTFIVTAISGGNPSELRMGETGIQINTGNSSSGEGEIDMEGNGTVLFSSADNVGATFAVAMPYESSTTTAGVFYNRGTGTGNTGAISCGASCSLSAAQLLSGLLVSGGSNSAVTITFDSAADIVAAFPSSTPAQIGARFDVVFAATGACTLTIVVGAGNTLNFGGWASGGTVGNGQTVFHGVITEVTPTPAVLFY